MLPEAPSPVPGHAGCKSLAVHWSLLGTTGAVEDVASGGLVREVMVVPLAVVAGVEGLLAEFLDKPEHPASSTTAKVVVASNAGRVTCLSLPDKGTPADRAIG